MNTRYRIVRHKISRALIALFFCAIAPGVALAHDYWLEPETFFAPMGASLSVRMNMGDRLQIEAERPLQLLRTVSFQTFGRNATQNLMTTERDGQMPVARITPTRAGNYLIAMERNAALALLEPEKFTEYLTEEGLDSIIAERARLGESERSGRERYRRYLKTLLQIGDRRDSTFRRRVGHQLEIVPMSNPYNLRAGDSLRVRVFFEGRPFAGARIFALNRNSQLVATTSADGTVGFRLDREGLWLIRLVHMRRCALDCAEVEWESFWSAYTFGLR